MDTRRKKWGIEIVYIDEPEYVMKMLKIKKGYSTSKHYHPKKKETLFILEGIANIEVWKTERKGKGCTYHIRLEHRLSEADKKRQIVTINPRQTHRIVGATDCTIIEVSTQPKDDSVRVE